MSVGAQNNRASTRTRSLLRGMVIFANRMRSLDCMVRDVSENGAKLAFGDVPAIPDRFDLEIPARGQRLACRVAWRRGLEVGVAFEAREADGVETVFERLKALEEQNARLRRAIKAGQDD